MMDSKNPRFESPFIRSLVRKRDLYRQSVSSKETSPNTVTNSNRRREISFAPELQTTINKQITRRYHYQAQLFKQSQKDLYELQSRNTQGNISEGSMISRKSLVRSKTYGRKTSEQLSMSQNEDSPQGLITPNQQTVTPKPSSQSLKTYNRRSTIRVKSSSIVDAVAKNLKQRMSAVYNMDKNGALAEQTTENSQSSKVSINVSLNKSQSQTKKDSTVTSKYLKLPQNQKEKKTITRPKGKKNSDKGSQSFNYSKLARRTTKIGI